MASKIIFMGTPDFAVPVLEAIHRSDHKILEVYTQPPTKSGRGQKINYSKVFNFAEKLNLKVRCPISLKTREEINYLKKLNPDIVVVVAYGKILPTEMLDMDNILFLNVHASLLPKWRGAAPIQRSIMNMDSETGVSIMKIIPELDAGPVMMQSKIKIPQDINHRSLSEEMSKMGAKLILESIKLIQDNKANFVDQIESKATYAKKIQKDETKIDWYEDAKKIIAKINALHPNPGCWFELYGSRIKIIKAKEINSVKSKPGILLDKNFTIACLKNAIQILELKKEGKQSLTVEEFLKGNKINIGLNLN
jgi:methionyl-tRNA formyltransferase